MWLEVCAWHVVLNILVFFATCFDSSCSLGAPYNPGPPMGGWGRYLLIKFDYQFLWLLVCLQTFSPTSYYSLGTWVKQACKSNHKENEKLLCTSTPHPIPLHVCFSLFLSFCGFNKFCLPSPLSQQIEDAWKDCIIRCSASNVNV